MLNIPGLEDAMQLTRWIELAHDKGASDVHLEPGVPLALRIDGQLQVVGEPLTATMTLAIARQVVPEASWPAFLSRRSWDMSRLVAGRPCRINVLQSARGVGLAVRLFSTDEPSLERLNLHPDMDGLVARSHGLVLICGATGAGKSSTLAALVQEINRRRACHILTIEQPLEYTFTPRRSLIRQREVGRDTPSFDQALMDAMREDPDVIVVGEMRRRETMQLTLDAAETGHLVLATMHASSPSEALQRIIAAFPAEAQDGVRAQLADCLEAVLCQRLVYRKEAGIRVPECSLLLANTAVRSNVRDGQLYKLNQTMEVGAREGMWSYERYERWLDQRTSWCRPERAAETSGRKVLASEMAAPDPLLLPLDALPLASDSTTEAGQTASSSPGVAVVEDTSDLNAIIAELESRD